jgi:hypothetical protein
MTVAYGEFPHAVNIPKGVLVPRQGYSSLRAFIGSTRVARAAGALQAASAAAASTPVTPTIQAVPIDPVGRPRSKAVW